MITSEQIPVDFEGLKKGDVIDSAHIERVYNIRRALQPDKFRLCMLQLREEIEHRRPDLLTRSDGDSVRIMTDQEADLHTMTRSEYAVRQLARNARRRAVIDRTEFSDVQKAVAESRDRAITMLALLTSKELSRTQRETALLEDSRPKKKK